jgi:LuxR family maltose regulon positive regulatory protein
MPTTLLATKLYIPSPGPQLVPRARLAGVIDAALRRGCRLALLAAPAGFGKTTAVATWVRSAGAPPTAWLALDEDDNQLDRFLTYLIAAVETVRPGAGQQAQALLHAGEAAPSARATLTELLNALTAVDDQLVLVLEDYHALTHDLIHEAVTFLLDRMPPQLHLIITSRADPPLPLARLRARQQLAELRAADLRFTPDEAADLLTHCYGLHLTPEVTTALTARTEGWAAGLQLAALALLEQDPAQRDARLADFTGSHRYVLDYLAEEVFGRQPELLQTFLLQTSVLKRMCGSLCSALTGQPDGQAVLEQLERANLFLVRLDDERTWYRYHHLFADFLSGRLVRAVGEDGCAQLHQQASAWFEQQGLVGEAIDHALAARDWDRVLRLLGMVATRQDFPDYQLDWRRWEALLPDDLLRRHPDLALGLAQSLVLIGQVETAERPLRLAEEGWQMLGDAAALGRPLSVRAAAGVLRGDHARAHRLAQQALGQLAPADDRYRKLATFALGASSAFRGELADAETALAQVLADTPSEATSVAEAGARATVPVTMYLRGRLHAAAEGFRDVIQRASASATQQQPAVLAFLGLIQYEWNDLAAAEQTLIQGVVAGQQTGRIRYWPVMYCALARLHAARGEWERADAQLAQARQFARLAGSSFLLREAEAWRVQLGLARGDLAPATEWLTTSGLGVDDAVSYERQAAYLALARSHLALERHSGAGDLPGVARLLDRLLRAAEVAGRIREVIEIRVLQAQVYAALCERDAAAQALIRALALAEPEGFVRTFVDAGPPLLELLAWPEVQRAAPAYTRRLAQAASLPSDRVPPASLPMAAPGILSGREVAILRLLAQGQSVQEIAAALIISIHTARTHVKNIYAKLEAHNRAQAIRRAHDLHLL